jgi:hypothetical protein
MKTALFSFIPISDRSMVASVKIARFLENTLQMPAIWTTAIEEHSNLDVLFIVNGAYLYCRVLEELSIAILGAKRIVWVQNDYTIIPPPNDSGATSPFRNAFVARRKVGKPHIDYWTTCEKESKATPLSNYINWNCLTLLDKPLKPTITHKDVAYYGSYRSGRVKAFKRFFNEPRCKIALSSPSKKFNELYRHPLIQHSATTPDLLRWLSERGLGLYLEDRRSHSEFHSPPNRFYEMLSAGLPMVFEEEAGATLRKAGYDPAEFLVSNPLSVARALDLRDKIKKKQYEHWYSLALVEHGLLEKKVKAAYKQLENGL